MNEVTDVLRAARDLLSEPGAWTQGTYARASNGRDTDACASDATAWCAIGALTRAGRDLGLAGLAEHLMITVLPADRPRPQPGLAMYNDDPDRTLDDVLDVFAKAIKHSEDPS